jgi:hypothetical protein
VQVTRAPPRRGGGATPPARPRPAEPSVDAGGSGSNARAPNARHPARVGRETVVTTSASRPMRRSACRAPGTIDQPTSWPWLLASTRDVRVAAQPGAEQRAERRPEPDGAGAVLAGEQPPAGRLGSGTMTEVGWRCIGKGSRASKASLPPRGVDGEPVRREMVASSSR